MQAVKTAGEVRSQDHGIRPSILWSTGSQLCTPL